MNDNNMLLKNEIEARCRGKERELLEHYFGGLVHEAATVRPETIGDYAKELPLQIEAEYFEFLRGLWEEVRGDDTRSLDDLLDKRHLAMLMTDDERQAVEHAHRDATCRTLWERLTRTNHRDVTYYKGLLRDYAEELLVCLRCDFIEDIVNSCNE